ncbi:hypothetical protein COLO4_33347 [Corchorus olitorius]|uniref:RRM domain-containing protein n=1 Tax=Corchorus olitorius TaxID=93759 RepID=A0A1R3GUE7_9ROSI|nr:hypothetical protein COLO4_33347 [Corchorus olitorius]
MRRRELSRLREAPRQRFQSGRSGDTESFRWLLSLHTTFVSNISTRISRKDIWDLFNDYGGVVDVFVPSRRRNSSSIFAFVRYCYEEKRIKAVTLANRRRVDGRFLMVRKATVRKVDRDPADDFGRRRFQSQSYRRRSYGSQLGRSQRILRGIMSGPKVLSTSNDNGVGNDFEKREVEEELEKEVAVDMDDSYVFCEELELAVLIPEVDILWLERSVVVSIRDSADVFVVMNNIKDLEPGWLVEGLAARI